MDDFEFDDDSDISEDRAYTRIDLNRATVGNQWLERTWSGFFGVTTSLLQKPGNSEWFIVQNPEFSLTIDGNIYDPMMPGEIEISEECNELGASLLIRNAGADLEVVINCTALHEVPALVRTVSVTNLGTAEVTLDSLSSEIVKWEEKSGELVARRFFERQDDAYQCSAEDPCIAMLFGNRSMLFGSLEGGELQVNTPKPYQCLIQWRCSKALKQFESWTSPPTYMIPGDGDPLATFLRVEPEVVTQLKLAERREERIQNALGEG